MLVTGMFISQAMHHFGAGKIHLFKHLIGVIAMKAFNVGDTCLYVPDLSIAAVKEYTITKVGKDTVQCGSKEQTFYTAFLWPISCKEELLTILTERARLKKQFDDSMSLVYQLRNTL